MSRAILEADIDVPGITSPMTDSSLSGEVLEDIGVGLGSLHHELIPQRQYAHLDRIDSFRMLTQKTPTNDYGLPIYVLRADLIPDGIFDMDDIDRAQFVAAAGINIIYDEGFPTFDNGDALWSRMEFESDEAFALFKKYLDQAEKNGARRLEELAFEQTGTSADIAIHFDTYRKRLKEYFVYYNWAVRAKAFDMFRVAAYHKLREHRILSTTDKHFLEAEKILGLVVGYFGELSEETGKPKWLDELTPKVALDMLDKLTKLQRVSIGLSAHGLSAGEATDTPKNADVEVVLRQIASGARDPNARANEAKGMGLEALLQNPELAGMAQELIIRVGRT